MKRGLVLLCAAALLCLPVSCSAPDRTGAAPIKADAMDDPYGGVTAEEATALRSSGEVVLYWDTAERSDREQDFADYFAKYFGGTVTYRFCPLDDDAATLLRDEAAGAAPDLFRLTAGYWPRAALKGLTSTVSLLRQQGVVGLDHPALTRYRDMTESAYLFNGDCYAISVCYASPVMVAVNTELFSGYTVPSPADYFAEGEWNYNAFLRCCYELNRTAAGGQTIVGAVLGQPLWFLQADDADPMTFRGSTLTGSLLDSHALQTLAYCRTLLTTAGVTDDAKVFLQGRAGMLCDTADTLADVLVGCAFDWDVVPFPYGDDNASGNRPGTFMGWAVPFDATNPQGAVNFVIARQQFLNFHYSVSEGALWDTGYAVYNEAQRRRVTDAAHMVRPALFPHFGELTREADAFWEAVRGAEPIYDVADRYTALIRAAIGEEMNAAYS